MPDDNARGTKRVEALYTVVFAAATSGRMRSLQRIWCT